MRILQINNTHYRRGGADVVYLNTGNLLEKHGHEVFYFSQKSKYNIKCKTEGYFIEEIEFFSRNILKNILFFPKFIYSKNASNKLEELLKIFNPEIAHIHTYKGVLTPSILKKLKKYSIPVVISLHDFGFLCPHNSFLDGKQRICTKCNDTLNPLHCIINRCNRNNIVLSSISALEYILHKYLFPFSKYFSHLIGVSLFIFDLHYKKNEFRNKISHLYNFYPNSSNVGSSKYRGKYFLFYGRLSKEKGIMTLLEAWKELDNCLRLKIAGDGILKRSVELFIKENGLLNVEYVGFKEKDEMNELIQDASFIIVPSEWYENNPLTIIEAYANGKPVIASNVGGIPEIVRENETGYLFQMSNSVQLAKTILKAHNLDDKEYSKISLNAKLFAEKNFDDENHYKSLINLYYQLIK